uniref:Uncharacterized protein n=1 Tax=Anguilla anguilla TaxID=7936 RepID=A0A0E9V6Y7_ANGAN
MKVTDIGNEFKQQHAALKFHFLQKYNMARSESSRYFSS